MIFKVDDLDFNLKQKSFEVNKFYIVRGYKKHPSINLPFKNEKEKKKYS